MGDTLIEEHSIGPHNKDGDIYELTKDVHSKIINFDRSTISDSLKLLRIPFNNSEIDSYLNSIIVFGIKAFIYRLNRSDLLDICNLIKLGNNHQRHLSNHIFRNGINHFISNISDRDILINIRKRLYLEDDLNDSSDFSIEDIKKGIIDEIISIGFESLLNSLNISLLKRYCNELKIDDSGSKTEIVNRILDDVFNLLSSMEYSDILEHNKKKVRKTKKRKSQATSEDGISNKKSRVFDSSDSDDSSPNGKEKQKKRNSNGSDDDEDDGKSRTRMKHVSPPLENIKKGITGQELHNLYNFKDLQIWCKQQNLNYIGKKGVLIKRILNYFETGEVQDKKKGKKV